MPNWAFNTLKVKGSEKDRNAFARDMANYCTEHYDPSDLSKLRPAVFDLNFCVEIPAALRSTIKSFKRPEDCTDEEIECSKKLLTVYGVDNWYDWSCSYWGTKWNITDGEIRETPRMTIYDFSTAWAPPTAALLALSTRYQRLEFHNEYTIEGERGVWKTVFRNGAMRERKL